MQGIANQHKHTAIKNWKEELVAMHGFLGPLDDAGISCDVFTKFRGSGWPCERNHKITNQYNLRVLGMADVMCKEREK